MRFITDSFLVIHVFRTTKLNLNLCRFELELNAMEVFGGHLILVMNNRARAIT